MPSKPAQMSTTPPSPGTLVFLATRWGPFEGGINTFNWRLLQELAAIWTLGKVCCIVEKEEDGKIFEHADIELVVSGEPYLLEAVNSWCDGIDLGLSTLAQAKYVLGHDVITGFHALALSKRLNCSSVIFKHQSYKDYYQSRNKDIADYAAKTAQQLELFSSADLCVAVGPLLKRSLQAVSNKPIHELIPGVDLSQHSSERHAISCVMSGRLDEGNRILKGIDLAIESFGEAIKTLRNSGSELLSLEPTLTLIGCSCKNETITEFERKLSATAQMRVKLLPYPYLVGEELDNRLHGVNLVLQPSYHEGFGLSAWEALGKGIPIVVTEQSGLYLQLQADNLDTHVATNKYLSSADGTPGKDDIDSLSGAIVRIYKNLQKSIEVAQNLKDIAGAQYTWRRCAADLVRHLGYTALADKCRYASVGDPSYSAKVLSGASAGALGESITIASTLNSFGRYREAEAEIDDTLLNNVQDSEPALAAEAYLVRAESRLRLCENEASFGDVANALKLLRDDPQVQM